MSSLGAGCPLHVCTILRPTMLQMGRNADTLVSLASSLSQVPVLGSVGILVCSSWNASLLWTYMHSSIALQAGW